MDVLQKDFKLDVPDRDIASLAEVLKCLIDIVGFNPCDTH